MNTNPSAAVGAWFLGPNGENKKIFRELLVKAVDSHAGFRQR